MPVIDGFQRFGDFKAFALDVRLLNDPDDIRYTPLNSVGSWGAFRLWVSGHNLTLLQLKQGENTVELSEVRWYLAPLFRWLAKVWNPLLHESRRPRFLGESEHPPRWARTAYLSVLRGFGDDARFAPWQDWAQRHSLRACAEGGIFPDVFFQRVGDDIEITWGDRTSVGSESAAFITDSGASRTSVDGIASALDAALRWFVAQPGLRQAPWNAQLVSDIGKRLTEDQALSRLSWFVEASQQPGHLTSYVLEKLESVKDRVLNIAGIPWLAGLAPQVAMFGAVSPQLSGSAASRLLATTLAAKTDQQESSDLTKHVNETPAWSSVAPWDEGYGLARDVLDELDPRPNSIKTEIEIIISSLGIKTKSENLDANGPRGVAIAGPGYCPTILVNRDHPMNSEQSGVRFTLAHEFCHILFDRAKARPIIHASTPWAEPAVEQRANAFAAMLLMPLNRIAIEASPDDIDALQGELSRLSRELDVGRTALIRHLANLGQINSSAAERLLSGL
jgi:Zn-dependent peptidase ImmA (M78 family)